MTEPVFVAESARLLIAAGAGIILLLLLIIKFKIHPILSLLISALVIGLGAGMPVPTNIINLRLDITHLYYPAKNSFQKGRLKRREIFTELLLYTLTT